MQVFLFDQDPELRAVWGTALTVAGHQVTSADRADAIHPRLFTQSLDVALIELGLRAGDGLSLAALVTFHCRDCRVLLLTEGGLFPHGELYSLAPSISSVLRKPLPVDEMVAVTEYYGARARANRATYAAHVPRYKKGGDTREEEGAAA